MSQRPQILAACLRLLACGPTTTRDLSLHTRAPRALIAVALHGEPGVTRSGNEWSLDTSAIVRRAPCESAPVMVRGKPESKAITYLRDHPGWYHYAELAERCELTYASVVQSVMRNRSDLKFSADDARRVLVAWKGAACPAS